MSGPDPGARRRASASIARVCLRAASGSHEKFGPAIIRHPEKSPWSEGLNKESERPHPASGAHKNVEPEQIALLRENGKTGRTYEELWRFSAQASGDSCGKKMTRGCGTL